MKQPTPAGSGESHPPEADFEITDEIRAQIGVESEPWPYEVTSARLAAARR
jgi:hypothetical protein